MNLPAGAEPATFFLEAVVAELPLILEHLGESPAARTLVHWLRAERDDAGETAEDAEEAPPPASKPAKGLNADEFAAFLQRKKQDGAP